MSLLVKNSVIYAIGDISPRLLSFISFPILTTYLTPAEYGIVNYVNTINLFLTIIGFLCLNTYYLVYYYKMKNEVEQKKLLGNLSIFVISLNLILTVFFFLIGPRLFIDIGNVDFYPYIAIGLITNFFNILTVLPSALYRVLENPLPLTILNVIKGILIFGLTLWFVVGFHFRAEGILAANMYISIFFGIIFGYITWRNMIWNINFKQIKKALLFSLPLVPGSLSYQLTAMSDRILIDKYLNLTDLGIYSTASTLALLLNIVAYGAYKAFEPYFFKIYGKDHFLTEFLKIRNGYFLVIILGAFGLALFAKEFFQIFANVAFHRSYFYVPLILIGLVASSMSMLYSTIITAREKTKINSLITICGGIVSLILNISLLRHFGIIAACFTSAIVLTLSLILSIHYSRVRITHLRIIYVIILMALTIGFFVYVLPNNNVIFSLIYKAFIFMFIGLITFKMLGFSLVNLKTILRQ